MYADVPCCSSLFIYEARRPFLLPRVKRRILLGLVGNVGLALESLPDRFLYELFEESEVDLLRFSSARMSSSETLR
jgi:hypothetical protein